MAGIQPSSLPEPFSPREVEVLRLIQEGLTNREIAKSLSVSLDTVKWYNQQIFAKLGVNNRTRAIEQARRYGLIDLHPAPSAWDIPHPKHNLPASLSSFIGRKNELAELHSLLQADHPRLVTLTGPGGVGKTRLAIYAGWRLLEHFPSGVFFVSLAATREAGLVIPAIAAVFSLHEIPNRSLADLLKEHLRRKCLLLILDNFEQVLPAGPLVCDLLEAAPGVKALVTSREILRLSGEQVYHLAPLPLPQTGEALSFQDILENESVQLFVARAWAVQPGFHLDEENAPAVMEICRKLDGLPLALELAAARLRLITPREMLVQLDHRLRLLTGGVRDLPLRQQTLRASLKWSYALLSPSEQVLFHRLGVFVGGCTQEAAEAVCGEAGLDVFDGIEALLDKHLLQRSEMNGEARLGMFETVREFALECLERSGESPLIQRKWADFYGQWMFRNYQQLNLLETELENFRAVMRWSIDYDQADPGFWITRHTWFWSKRNTEWKYWMEALLGLPNAQVPSTGKMWVVWHAFLQALNVQNYARCRIYLDEFLALAVELKDEYAINNFKYLEGYLCMGNGDFEGAMGAFSEGLARFKDSGHPFATAVFTDGLGLSLLLLHDYERAEAALQEALAIFTQRQTRTCMIETLTSLGYVALEKDEFPQAKEYLAKAIDQAREIGFDAGLADCLNGLASMAYMQGDLLRAARLFGAAEGLAIRFGCSTHEPPLIMISTNYQTALRQRLDPDALESAWQEGRGMSMEEALAYGLENPPQ